MVPARMVRGAITPSLLIYALGVAPDRWSGMGMVVDDAQRRARRDFRKIRSTSYSVR